MKAKHKVKLKRAWYYLSALFLAVCCFTGSYWAFENSSENLGNLTRLTAPVAESGQTNSTTNVSGKYNLNRKVFYFRLHGSKELLGIYRPSQNYSDLQTLILPEKEITVYFKDDGIDNKINLQTYQLESNGQTIIESSDYRKRETLAGWLGLAGGLLLCFLAIRHDRKYWRKNTATNKTYSA